jgi:butyryl-CoA dehydrogenase
MLEAQLKFLMSDVFRLDEVILRPHYQHLDREDLAAVLATSAKLADTAFAPIAAAIDADEPVMREGRVLTHPRLRPALEGYARLGLIGTNFHRDMGGLQLPALASSALMVLFAAACTPAAGYVFMTAAAARLIAHHGSEWQRMTFVPPMLAGRWYGTMCLSEPQAGSSLGDVKTTAHPRNDGTFLLRGQKMWISGGDHDLSENIVHLVMARLEGAPSGARGLSLFIVPQRRLDGSWNGISLVGLNHKLGHRGTTNCALAFGADGACVGTLMGEPHRGLDCMFHMMNEARIGVGTTAASNAHAAFRYALDYASSRRQGRRFGSGEPANLIDHPDVRRMLLFQKAISEGGLALGLAAARLLDDTHSLEDDNARHSASILLDLLTPLVKLWCSERGVEANSSAIQVMGGAGYVRDHPVERLFRDQRLNPIHEGTNGILSIDVVMRKSRAEGGRGLKPLFRSIETEECVDGDSQLVAELGAELRQARARLEAIFSRIADPLGDDLEALSHATPMALALGDLVVAWLWLKQVRAIEQRTDDFSTGKRAAASFFFRYVLAPSLTLAGALEGSGAPHARLTMADF